VTRCDDKPTDRAQRTALRMAINELYNKHGALSTFSVSVLPLRDMDMESGEASCASPLSKIQSSSIVQEVRSGNPSASRTNSSHPLAARTKFGGSSNLLVLPETTEASFPVAGGGSLGTELQVKIHG